MALEERELPTKLLVLGRGIHEGVPTQQTADNARAAVNYYHSVDGAVDMVVFSGGHSHLAGVDAYAGATEAEAMARIAEESGLPAAKIQRETSASSTVGNIVLSAPLLSLSPDTVTGIITHRNQIPRAITIGSRVLGKVVPIVAEDYEAEPELGGKWLERLVLQPKDRLAMTGVRPGDLAKARQRYELLVKADALMGPCKGLLRKLTQYS